MCVAQRPAQLAYSMLCTPVVPFLQSYSRLGYSRLGQSPKVNSRELLWQNFTDQMPLLSLKQQHQGTEGSWYGSFTLLLITQHIKSILKIWIGPDWSAGYNVRSVVNWCVFRHSYVPRHTVLRYGESLYACTWIQAIATFHVEL